jgi:hypothetical protein
MFRTVLLRSVFFVVAGLGGVVVLVALYLGFSTAVHRVTTALVGTSAQSWDLFGVPFTPIHAGWQAVVWMLFGAFGFGLVMGILSIPKEAFGRRGAAVFYAALMVAGAVLLSNRYQVVQTRNGEAARLDRLTGDLVLLESGQTLRDINRTITLTFVKGKYTLEIYWSQGKVHYRARFRCTEEQFKKAVARSIVRKDGRVMVLAFTLTNRFREAITSFEVPAGLFRKGDKEDNEMEVACGSVPLSKEEYEEFASGEHAYVRDYLEPLMEP